MDHEERLTELKEIVASQGKLLKLPSVNEGLRRRCSALLLQATHTFLISWEKSSTKNELPNGLILQVFSLLVSQLGPGDSQVRTWLLTTLPELESTDGRQLLLDVLPWFMEFDLKQKEEATEAILLVFREILVKDPKILLPVIGCLSSLPLSERGHAEAWNVALASLPVADETDLPVLVKSLLCNVTDDTNATKALHAIREETRLLEDSGDDCGRDQIPLVSLVVVNALKDRNNGRLLSETYTAILQQVSLNARKVPKPHPRQNEKQASFCLLDMMVLLNLYHEPTFKFTISKVIDELIFIDKFPFQCMESLLNLTIHCDKRGQQTTVIQDCISLPLQSFALFLILSPARVSPLSASMLVETRHFVTGLHRRLDRDRQEELVRSMLYLSNESSQVLSNRRDGLINKDRTRRRGNLHQNHGNLLVTIETVHHILMEIGKSSPASLSKFKYFLMELLTTESDVSTLVTKHVCELLAILMEPVHFSQNGIDSTELMILLQKLLFMSSFRQKMNLSGNDDGRNIARIIRGLILANELVKSSSLSSTDKECMHQWIEQLLLPSNRRTVCPSLGRQGLQFLLSWKQVHDNHDSYKSVFNTIRMIMANTGLVQLLSHYSQTRADRKKSVLVYSRLPGFFSSACEGNNNHKRKTRELVLCIDTFLRFRGTSSPKSWLTEVTWIFDLVNAYLELGRNESANAHTLLSGNIPKRKSVGWTPDGWLEASIELPSLLFILSNLNEDNEGNSVVLEAFNFDLNDLHKAIDKKATKEMVEILLKSKNGCNLEKIGDGFLRFAAGVALAAGLSIAVLKNAHGHFETAGYGERGKKLVQYQVMKILDLEMKAILVVDILVSISDALSRSVKTEASTDNGKSRPLENNGDPDSLELPVKFHPKGAGVLSPQFQKLRDDIDAAVTSLNTIIDFLFHSKDSLMGHQILYDSLSHTNDDLVMNLFLSHNILPVELRLSANMVIEVRLRVLRHLCQNLGRNLKRQILDLNCSIGTRSLMPSDDIFARIMNTAAHLSMKLPAFRREHYTDGLDIEFSKLAALHATYLSMFREHFIHHREKCVGQFAQHFAAEDNIEDITLDVVLVQHQAVQSLLFHLHSCDDQFTAMIFVDVLGLLALKDGSLVDLACDICWRALHTVFTVQSDDHLNQLPYTFLFATKTLLDDRDKAEVSKVNHLAKHAIISSVARASTNSSKDYKENSVMGRWLLLLWALMIQPTCTEGRACSFISKLINELDRLLLSTSESNGKEQGKSEKGGKNHVLLIPGLSSSALGFFVDVIANITVATLAIVPPANWNNGDESPEPFQHFLSYLRHFGRVLDLFRKYTKAFPRRSVVRILNSCQLILNLCQYHVIRCVEWRNMQPILTPAERRIGKYDPGSIKHLDCLLKQVAANGVGRITSFCDWARVGWRSSRAVVEGNVSGPDDINAWLYASHYKKFSALMHSTEKAMISLRSIALAHNLLPPTSEYEFSASSDSMEEMTPKSDDTDDGFHEISWESMCAISTLQKRPKKKKRRVTPVLLEVDVGAMRTEFLIARKKTPLQDNTLIIKSDKEIIEGVVDDDSSGDSLGDFEVSGGWGEIELSGSDDGSLTLENNTLFSSS